MTLKSISAKLSLIRRFLSFWKSAKSIDSVDSPLLYNLAFKIRNSDDSSPDIMRIEQRRQSLLKKGTIINRESLGAPSTIYDKNEVSISQIAQSAVSPRYKCDLLRKIVEWSEAAEVLELGTSLAINTAYISTAENVKRIDTVEGSKSISSVNEQDSHNDKIRFHTASFESFIEAQLNKGTKYDCIVLDGHHEYLPTISYVAQCRHMLNPAGLIVLDDIYWSQGMTKAWLELKLSQDYNMSIDLFFYGILSMKPAVHEPIDVKLWPFKTRWQLGLFR